MFGKTQHDSAAAAVADALDDSTDNDCADLRFDTGRKTFSVQFADPDDGRDTVHNVAALDKGDPATVADAVDLPIQEQGDIYVLLASDATTVDDVLAEVKAIAAAFDATLDDAAATKAFTLGKPTALGNLKSLLGWA